MSATITPEVLWAQRSSQDDPSKNIIYLTINVSDIKPDTLKLDLTPSKLCFSGENKSNKYAVELEFFEEIDEKESKEYTFGRGIEYILRKKNAKAEYWPRLLKESKKLQFVKTDFDKWVDEDEQDSNDDAGLGGMGGDMSGMGGEMPGMGGMGGMGGVDFAKMMGSMGGAGGMDMSNMGGEGADTGADVDLDDDEDMPELEVNEPKTEEIDEKKIEELK